MKKWTIEAERVVHVTAVVEAENEEEAEENFLDGKTLSESLDPLLGDNDDIMSIEETEE